MDELRALGFRTVPVTVIGDKAIAGFRPNDISQALDLGLVVAARDPGQTIPLLERMVEAVLGAIKQMPDEQLGFEAPDGRPLPQFSYHIVRMVERTLEGLVRVCFS